MQKPTKRYYSQAETRWHLGQARAGNREATGRLVEAYHDMIARLARTASRSCGMAFEDTYQEATVVFLEAIHRFDPTREASFTTFAWSQIWGALANLSRDERRDSELFEPLVGEVEQRESVNVERDHEPMAIDLPERLRETICMLYGIGCAACNPREASRRLGISVETVEAREREALDLLRRSERRVA